MKKRKYLPTIEDLIDRLSIFQLKDGDHFVEIPEQHKEKYAQDIQDILNDIDIILDDDYYNGEVNAKTIKSSHSVSTNEYSYLV